MEPADLVQKAVSDGRRVVVNVGNTASQRIRLSSGIAASYTPTAIGADGAVCAVNNAGLFSTAR